MQSAPFKLTTADCIKGAEELTFSTSKGSGIVIPQASDERPEEAPEASNDEPTDAKSKGE